MSGMRRRTWVVWGLFALLLVALFTVGRMDEDDDGHGHAGEGEDEQVDARWLLPVPADQLAAIEIVHEGALHRFERDAAGLWYYHGVHAEADPQHGHTTDPALAEKFETAIVGFSRARKERRIPLSEGAEDFGVRTPQIIVLAYAQGRPDPLAQYAFGDRAPDTVSRYVLQMGEKEVVTIANFHMDNLVNLIQTAVSVPQQATATRRRLNLSGGSH